MTDPVLAAMLKDPDPVARAIAADRAAELGDEEWASRLRLEGLARMLLQYSPPWPDAWGRGTLRLSIPRWRILVEPGRRDPAHAEITICSACVPQWARFRLRAGSNWEEYYRRGQAHCMRWRTPPPGLEAAVLAVLRRRLEEIYTT